MVRINEMKPGMRIKLVTEPPERSGMPVALNPKETEMGSYLGQTVTVVRVHERCVTIKEDHGKFAWTSPLIEKVITKEG
jgi:hypothetical protein